MGSPNASQNISCDLFLCGDDVNLSCQYEEIFEIEKKLNKVSITLASTRRKMRTTDKYNYAMKI